MTRPYSRIYHEIADDPRFAGVFDDNDCLATWVRMLLVADALYPVSAPLPRRVRAVRVLIDAGIVEERPGNRYVIHGLEAERERRRDAARNAAASRWSNAPALLVRDETSKDEQVGRKAPTNGSAFMGWRGNGTHDGRHGRSCMVCYPEQTKAPA
jgi:hypothetical protein